MTISKKQSVKQAGLKGWYELGWNELEYQLGELVSNKELVSPGIRVTFQLHAIIKLQKIKGGQNEKGQI